MKVSYIFLNKHVKILKTLPLAFCNIRFHLIQDSSVMNTLFSLTLILIKNFIGL